VTALEPSLPALDAAAAAAAAEEEEDAEEEEIEEEVRGSRRPLNPSSALEGVAVPRRVYVTTPL
jgi:hypothetical protein